MDFKEVYEDTCSSVGVAARNGDIDALKDLLARDKPYDVKDNRGWTCLHEAASNGHVQCLEILLQIEDIEVDVRTFEWETSLILASSRGHKDCVASLIDHGADPNAHTCDMDSPLCKAAMENHVDCVRVLLEKGADVNQGYFTDDTPLHIAILQHGNMDIIQALVESGADLLSRNEHEITPIFVAAQFGRLDCMLYLIQRIKMNEKGEKAVENYVNTAAYDFATPLYIATQGGFADCVNVLLKNGADPLKGPKIQSNDVTIYPVQAAIENNDLRCFRLLSDSLDGVLKRYHYTKPEPFDLDPLTTQPYHPFLMAQQHKDISIFKEMWNNIKSAIRSDFAAHINMFEYEMSLPAAIMYMKYMFKEKHEVLCNCLPSFEISYKNVPILVAALRLNDHRIVRIMFNDVLHKKTFLQSRVSRLYVCMRKIYFAGSGTDSYLIDQADIMMQKLPYLMHLCLIPVLSSLPISNQETTTSRWHLLGSQLKGLKSQDEAQFLEDKISKVLVSNSLQHQCRVAIVSRLVNCSNYNMGAVDSLRLPDMLKNYVKYKEFGPVGEAIMDKFTELGSIEKLVDTEWTNAVV